MKTFLSIFMVTIIWNSHDFNGEPSPNHVTFLLSESDRDQQLEQTINKAFELQSTPQHQTRYYYNRFDFNDDGEEEIFAYLVGPSLCGTGGCSA